MHAGLKEKLQSHPHASAVLGGGLETGLSHAYLLTGPGESTKAEVVSWIAAALLTGEDGDMEVTHDRLKRGTHPDCVWVKPSGAHEMLRADIDEPVVAAATHTPFEASKRVFVIERAETMNDEAANRLLKTLEEPPEYVHLLLLADNAEDVLPTIKSRCQHVRFKPMSVESIETVLVGGGASGEQVQAGAKLALGDLDLAERLVSEGGVRLRQSVAQFAFSTLRGDAGQQKPWLELLTQAKAHGEEVAADLAEGLEELLELTPKKERKKVESEAADRAKRARRRAETQTLALGLMLIGSIYRDLLVLSYETPEQVWNVDLEQSLSEFVGGVNPVQIRQAIALVEDTRAALQLNVGAELALEALAYRSESLFSNN